MKLTLFIVRLTVALCFIGMVVTNTIALVKINNLSESISKIKQDTIWVERKDTEIVVNDIVELNAQNQDSVRIYFDSIYKSLNK